MPLLSHLRNLRGVATFTLSPLLRGRPQPTAIKVVRRQTHSKSRGEHDSHSSSTTNTSGHNTHDTNEGKHAWKARMSDLLEQTLERKRYSSALLYVIAGFFSIYGSYVIWGWNLRYSNVNEFLKKAGSTQTTEDIFRLQHFYDECMDYSYPEELLTSQFEAEFHKEFPKKEVHVHHNSEKEMLDYTNQCIKVALRFSEIMENCKNGNKEQCKLANNLLGSRYRTEIRFNTIQLLFENLKLFHWIAFPVEYMEARYIFRNNLTGERLMQSTLIGPESIKPLFNVALPLRAVVEYKDQSPHANSIYEYFGNASNDFTKAMHKSEEKWKKKGVVRQSQGEKKAFQPDGQEVQIVFELVKEALKKHSERKLNEKNNKHNTNSNNAHTTTSNRSNPINVGSVTSQNTQNDKSNNTNTRDSNATPATPHHSETTLLNNDNYNISESQRESELVSVITSPLVALSNEDSFHEDDEDDGGGRDRKLKGSKEKF
eukprot:TRINITY_DN6490_c0_g1_i2.p1 TRINITY_DN6490_c0_g1~~TRINITY_DN6490_c0_g1_i2.p1  ORF type:complete len:485 (-),score=104.28 TRINITY_DN6490_c0_g1_i2:117-1571(-)